jgi:hypothetical protein
MPEVVTCPKCERQLRVPDELIGQRVKCPTCGPNFTANINRKDPKEDAGDELPRPSAPMLTEPQYPVSEGDQSTETRSPRPRERSEDDYEQSYSRDRSRKRPLNSLKPPAICLLTLSVITLGCDAWGAFRALFLPVPTVQQALDSIPAGMRGQGNEEGVKIALTLFTGPSGAALALVGLLFTFVIIAGSIAMIAGRMRWLGILASIAALLNNFQYCCCVLTLPFGIWSLVLLLGEDVKRAFEAR